MVVLYALAPLHAKTMNTPHGIGKVCGENEGGLLYMNTIT